MREKLRRIEALLRREIPDGDPGAIFVRGAEVNPAPLIWRVRFASVRRALGYGRTKNR